MNIKLSQKDIYSGDLILVNGVHPYLEKTDKKDLVYVYEGNDKILLSRKVSAVFAKIMEEIGGTDKVSVVSGWRSRCEQEELYASSLEEKGISFTGRYVALPGHSEHQTGLAVDLALKNGDWDIIRPEFTCGDICMAFREMSTRYGFVERYPQNKENITGIAHEPWHFRYIGTPHSEIMAKHDMCLEEYIEFIKGFVRGQREYYHSTVMQKVYVSYLPAPDSGTVCAEVDEGFPYKISGNNVDGYIITEWRQE